MPANRLWVPAGFMITNWLMRTRGMTLGVALKTFADHRPAGIYKEDYIRALYKYYHEPLYACLFPAPPTGACMLSARGSMCCFQCRQLSGHPHHISFLPVKPARRSMKCYVQG